MSDLVGMILIGACVYLGLGSAGSKALICMAFVLVTSPTAAHALARGAHKFGVRLESPSFVDKYAEEVDRREQFAGKREDH